MFLSSFSMALKIIHMGLSIIYTDNLLTQQSILEFKSKECFYGI